MAVDKNILRLEHILESIEKIEYKSKDLSFDDYLKDWIRQDAIHRNIEIIGEATSAIDESLRDKYPKIPWIEAKNMRIFLVHEYFKVNAKRSRNCSPLVRNHLVLP